MDNSTILLEIAKDSRYFELESFTPEEQFQELTLLFDTSLILRLYNSGYDNFTTDETIELLRCLNFIVSDKLSEVLVYLVVFQMHKKKAILQTNFDPTLCSHNSKSLNEDILIEYREINNKERKLWKKKYRERNIWGNKSSLCTLAFFGHLDLIKWYIDKNKNKTKKINPENLKLAFIYASMGGHIDAIKFFLGLVESVDLHNGFCQACINGKLEAAKFLLNLPKFDRSGDFYECGIVSCENNHIDVVKFLVDNNFNSYDCSFYNCFMASCKHKDMVLIKYFLSSDSKEINSDLAVQIIWRDYPNCIDILKLFFEKIPNMCIIELFRTTCYRDRYKKIAEYLLSSERDIDLSNHRYIKTAVENGSLSMVKMLIEKGANVNSYTRNGRILTDSPIIDAAFAKNLSMIKLLVELGADIRTRADIVLIIASKYEKIDIMRYCIDLVCDIHADNDDAYITACEYGKLESVKLLLELGVDPNNQQALKEAITGGHKHVIDYLSEKGVLLTS